MRQTLCLLALVLIVTTIAHLRKLDQANLARQAQMADANPQMAGAEYLDARADGGEGALLLAGEPPAPIE